jgi:hypothetical protein
MRTIELNPHDFRIARRPDGSLVFQGAYRWWDDQYGTDVEWRDIPVVDVDEEGKAK